MSEREQFIAQREDDYLTVCYFCAGTGQVPPTNPTADCVTCSTSGYLWESK